MGPEKQSVSVGYRPPLTLAAALVAAFTASPAFAGQESYGVHTELLNPEFGTQTFVPFDLPQFDDQGGSRVLDSVSITYSLLIDLRLVVAGNPTDNYVGNETAFTFEWEAFDGIGPLLPYGGSLHSGNTFAGYDAMPNEGAGTYSITGFGVGNAESVADPAFLARVSGAAPIPSQSIFTVSFATDRPPPFGVWDPNLYELSILRLYVDMDLTYNYSVPAPGVASAAGIAVACFHRRNRRY